MHINTATVQKLHQNLEFFGFGAKKKTAKLDVCVRIWEGIGNVATEVFLLCECGLF
jgi:hypothetical protein